MSDSDRGANPDLKLLAGVVLAIGMGVAYIYMKQNDIEYDGLFAVLSPLVVFLIIGSQMDQQNAKVEKQAERQEQKLDTIQRQTNGMLDKTWSNGYRQAALDLVAQGMVPAEAVVGVTPPPRPMEEQSADSPQDDQRQH